MSKDARITSLAIMKSMLESGNYRVPDDEFQSTLQGFIQMVDRVAGPAEQNSGGYQTPHAKPAGGGGDVHEFRVIAVEDKGTRISLQVEVGSETKWVSAWDQAKVEARGLQPGGRFRAKMSNSKCGKYWNVKNIVPDIPF